VENNKQTIFQNANLCIPDSAHSGCLCRAEHIDIFLHVLIFLVLSELKLLFPLIFLNTVRHLHVSIWPICLKKTIFLLVDKAGDLCIGACKTGRHNITYLLSVRQSTRIV